MSSKPESLLPESAGQWIFARTVACKASQPGKKANKPARAASFAHFGSGNYYNYKSSLLLLARLGSNLYSASVLANEHTFLVRRLSIVHTRSLAWRQMHDAFVRASERASVFQSRRKTNSTIKKPPRLLLTLDVFARPPELHKASSRAGKFMLPIAPTSSFVRSFQVDWLNNLIAGLEAILEPLLFHNSSPIPFPSPKHPKPGPIYSQMLASELFSRFVEKLSLAQLAHETSLFASTHLSELREGDGDHLAAGCMVTMKPRSDHQHYHR